MNGIVKQKMSQINLSPPEDSQAVEGAWSGGVDRLGIPLGGFVPAAAAGADKSSRQHDCTERAAVDPERCRRSMRPDQQAGQRGTNNARGGKQAPLQRDDPTHVFVASDPGCQRTPRGTRNGLTALEQSHESVGAPMVFEGCEPGAGEQLDGRRDQQHLSRVEPVRDVAGDTHCEDGRQGEGDHQQRDTRGPSALIVHPQDEGDHGERVADEGDGESGNHQTQVPVTPDRRSSTAGTAAQQPRRCLKWLLHTCEGIASQLDGQRLS